MPSRLHSSGIYWGAPSKKRTRELKKSHQGRNLFHTSFVDNDWKTGQHKKLFAIAPGCEPVDLNGYVVPNSSAVKGLSHDRTFLHRRRNPYSIETVPIMPEPSKAAKAKLSPKPPQSAQLRAPRTTRNPGPNRMPNLPQSSYASGSVTRRGNGNGNGQPRAQTAPVDAYARYYYSCRPQFRHPKHNSCGEFVPPNPPKFW